MKILSRRYVVAQGRSGWETVRDELPVFGLPGVSVEFLGRTKFIWRKAIDFPFQAG